MPKLRERKDCEYYSDCPLRRINRCPSPECRYKYPWVAPARLHDVIKVYKGLLDKPVTKDRHNWAINTLMRLRRQKKYQNDMQEQRRVIGIPAEGYSRREADSVLRRIKSRTPVMLAVYQFARDHPLDKNHPMPCYIALEELFLKRPRTGFLLCTALGGIVKDGEVFLEDGETKVPQAIARLVKYKLRGDDNEHTQCVTIEMFFGEDVVWLITAEPSLHIEP